MGNTIDELKATLVRAVEDGGRFSTDIWNSDAG